MINDENLNPAKLRVLKRAIDEILNRWNESFAEVFLEKARTGVYRDAEMDAIELRQLLLDSANLEKGLIKL